MSIRKKYFVELEEINQKLLLMQKKVISAIQESINALLNKDSLLIEDTFRKEKEIDSLERDIEQECLKILLMEHPVAGDFREVSAALKMITDLERIGDNARDICEIALQFNGKTYIKRLEHIPEMAKNAIAMVKDSVQSYIDQDLELARGLDKRDDRVDDLFAIVKKDLILLIKLDSSSADDAIMILMIAKYLERIADHAVNIGEWVDYCITGSHQ